MTDGIEKSIELAVASQIINMFGMTTGQDLATCRITILRSGNQTKGL